MNAHRSLSLAERFSRHYLPEPMSGCWLWTGALDTNGYGKLKDEGSRRLRPATHIALQLNGRSVPSGLLACHHCDVPLCVNPDHLFIGTQVDNIRDCMNKGRHSPPPKTDWPTIMRSARHHWQRLSRDDIPEIRRRLAGGELQKDIASTYGVGTDTIGKIKRGERWAHL